MVNKIKALSEKSVAATMAIKCYDEQIVSGTDGIIDSIKAISKDEFQAIAIEHNKSGDKKHWHILVRAVSRQKKFQVASMMKRLGVHFREGLDDDLWQHHGVETVGDFSAYATYLLHNTIEAQRAQKAPYEMTDIVTNLSKEELQQVLAGYSITKKPLRQGELNMCMDQAREAGYNLKNFYEFLDSLQITGLKDTEEKQLRNSYLAGVRRLKMENAVIDRVCILIAFDGTAEMKSRLLNATQKALVDKQTIYMTRDMDYIVEPSADAIVTTWDNSKLVDNKFLWSDGIYESTSRKSDVTGIWAGKYFITISKDGFMKRCAGEKIFGFKVVKGEIAEHFQPLAYYAPDELERLQEMYDDFYKKFRDAYDAI